MNLLRLSTSPLPVPASWYAIPLRLIVGFGFIQHGYAKLARGPEHFVGLLHAMGLPASFLLGWLTIIVELLGGLLILVGHTHWHNQIRANWHYRHAGQCHDRSEQSDSRWLCGGEQFHSSLAHLVS